jgi:hypothetical protein
VRTVRHGGTSRRVAEWFASLCTRACGYRGAAFEGEWCQHTTDISANGSALPRLLECDTCATEVVLRAGRQRVDTTCYYRLWHDITSAYVNSYWWVRSTLFSARRLHLSVSLPLPNQGSQSPCVQPDAEIGAPRQTV